MSKGKVKFFNAAKGFGFITLRRRTGCFVHYTAINGTGLRNLQEGQTVTFDIVDGAKGQQARNVTVV